VKGSYPDAGTNKSVVEHGRKTYSLPEGAMHYARMIDSGAVLAVVNTMNPEICA
jgi:hypothetical protein